MIKPTEDLNIRATETLIAPNKLKSEEFPASEKANETVIKGREDIKRILKGEDSRFLMIVGPCSIHDQKSALDYAGKLNELRKAYEDKIFTVMRVYFEKPRTTVGWKGLINDPYLNGISDVPAGIGLARKILLTINELGLPCATELLDPIIPQYIDDLVSWAAIGARTTESQTHREMASGLSMPVGFKNNTDGSSQVAVDAMISAKHPHHFLGIDQSGKACVVKTAGNPYGHVILRGGRSRPNYDAESIRETRELMEKAHLKPMIMVDCSHANSGKLPEKQEIVLDHVVDQRVNGELSLIGVMIESHLYEGSQKMTDNAVDLKYGVSITDPCISFETTERLYEKVYKTMSR